VTPARGRGPSAGRPPEAERHDHQHRRPGHERCPPAQARRDSGADQERRQHRAAAGHRVGQGQRRAGTGAVSVGQERGRHYQQQRARHPHRQRAGERDRRNPAESEQGDACHHAARGGEGGATSSQAPARPVTGQPAEHDARCERRGVQPDHRAAHAEVAPQPLGRRAQGVQQVREQPVQQERQPRRRGAPRRCRHP
jgi:hypothetical protein